MGILRFQDLSLVDFSAPLVKERVEELFRWSGGDLIMFSTAFVYARSDPKAEDDYFLPIGFLFEDHLVASFETIRQAEKQGWSFAPEEDRPFIREHLSMYYIKAGKIPSWGENRYYNLVQDGKTPRVLEGPNVSGCVKVHQRRYVVFDEDKELVYGPLLP